MPPPRPNPTPRCIGRSARQAALSFVAAGDAAPGHWCQAACAWPRPTPAGVTCDWIAATAPAPASSADAAGQGRLCRSASPALAEAGLNAPRVLEWDETHGFMLLNDLGAHTLMQHIQATQAVQGDAMLPQPAPRRPWAWYQQALDAPLRWQLASRPGELPVYDELLRRRTGLVSDWYSHPAPPGRARRDRTGHARPPVRPDRAAQSGQRLPYVHRDYMPRNLMLTAEGTLGILDFQDAVYGPATGDIASLMRDAFWTWDEEFVIDVTVRYWGTRPQGRVDGF